jgi:beta-glucosidase
VAEQLGDRVKHYFTINEFRSFVEAGYQLVDVKVGGKTLHLGGAPGLRLSDSELKQVRHHAVLGYGLAVQAIRAATLRAPRLGSRRTSASPSRSSTRPSTSRRRR